MRFYTNVVEHDGKILVKGYDDGERFHKRVAYAPTLYRHKLVPNPDARTLDGTPVVAIACKDIQQARFRASNMRNMGFPVYGTTNYAHAYIAENWPDEIPFDPSLIRSANIDIEVDSVGGFPHPDRAEAPVVAITCCYQGRYAVFGLKPYTPSRDDVVYVQCPDEGTLLRRFLRYWNKIDVDIITGWNVLGFDIPYLVNRARRVIGHKYASMMSPWGVVKERTIPVSMTREIKSYDLYGLAIIDYLAAYRKFRLKMQESYRLDYIGHVELGMKKLDYSEYGSLAELYRSDHQKYLDYNIRDVEIVEKLDEKLGFLTLVQSVAYLAGCNYQDVFAQTRVWDCILGRELAKRKMVLPAHKDASKEDKIAGAFVKSPQLGKHKWVVSFDAASLYPSTIVALNLGPETINHSLSVDFDIDRVVAEGIEAHEGYALAANGHHFRTDTQSFFSEMVQKVLDGRATQKRIMLNAEREIEERKSMGMSYEKEERIRARANTMQSALKVCANSLYGTMASPFFRFFDIDIAEAITLTGQLLIQWTAARVNEFLNAEFGTTNVDYVIAQDTDSCYISLEPVATGPDPLEKVMAFAHGPLAEAINRSSEQLAKNLGARENRWSFKAETVCLTGIWTAKKRYILDMLVSEAGVLNKPEIKITGLESVRTTTPEWARAKIKEAYKIAARGTETEFQDFYAQTRREFNELPAHEMAATTAVSTLDKYTPSDEDDDEVIKGTPIHAKASLIFNREIKRRGLDKKYSLITEGDKMRYVVMKMPNPVRAGQFGFIDVLPPELGLEKYIDYDHMFAKTIGRPLTKVADVVGWSVIHKRTLKRFMGE